MNTLDIRQLAGEWRELCEVFDLDLAIVEDDREATRRLREQFAEATYKYEDLCSEIGCEATPDALELWGDDFGPTLIPVEEFAEYAEEEARSVYDIPVHWPFNCIDWEYAARELRYDYTWITFDGDDYYVRSF